MNWIFFGLIATSVLTASLNGSMPQVTDATTASAKAALELALGLVGQMTLWLGLVGIIREAGMLTVLARVLRPVMTRLFPEVPADHPAMGSMLLNIAANMLGQGNAATPFGLKAMKELDSLNPRKGVATNAMATFLAINTTGIAVLPLTTIAVRASLGSKDAAGIIAPTLFATFTATVVAVVAARVLQGARWWAPERYEVQNLVPRTTSPDPAALDKSALDKAEAVAAIAHRMNPARLTAALTIGCVVLCALGRHLYVSLQSSSGLQVLRSVLSGWPIPLIILLVVLVGLARGVKLYETFIASAKESFQTAISVIPFLVGMLVAIGMFRASGAMDALVGVLAPVVTPLGFPAEALPMAFIRPLSGSGATGVMSELMKTHGPDSFLGYLVSVMNGGTETTFYVLALYFGVVQVKVLRHALPACVAADLASPAAALFICRLFFA